MMNFELLAAAYLKAPKKAHSKPQREPKRIQAKGSTTAGHTGKRTFQHRRCKETFARRASSQTGRKTHNGIFHYPTKRKTNNDF